MNLNRLCRGLVAAWCVSGFVLAAEPLPTRQPQVKLADIYFHHPGAKPALKYDRDVDIVKFKGRFLAAWNANEARAEDVPGQFNFLSISDDLEHWSPPGRMFTAEGKAKNLFESHNQWQPNFVNWKDQKLFCAWSDFGARRVFVAVSDDGVHGNNVRVPERISHDRHFLALYCAPVCGPELLLPGPVIQPQDGTAFYPKGFVDNGELYVAYTYPAGIRSSVIEALPDFTRPFLLPREGRPVLKIENGVAHFGRRQSSLSLVLTEKLTRQPKLRLAFDEVEAGLAARLQGHAATGAHGNVVVSVPIEIADRSFIPSLFKSATRPPLDPPPGSSMRERPSMSRPLFR